MTNAQWLRAAALVVFLVALVMVPPSYRLEGSGDIAWCRPLGLEWREPVSLYTGLTPSQNEVLNREFSLDTDEWFDMSVGEQERWNESSREARELSYAACDDARQDRQTLITISVAFAVGVLVVRRNRLESASRPLETDPTTKPSGEDAA